MKRPSVNLSEGSAADALSSTSSELLRQARADDQDAWTRLVEQYSRRMYRWTRQAGLQAADAANVVQESFEAVARKLADFRRDRPGDTFRGWLRRIVDNKIKDHYRRVGRMADQAVGGDGPGLPIEQLPTDKTSPETPSGNNSLWSEDATWDTSRTDSLGPATAPLRAAVEQVQNDVSARDWRIFWRTAIDGQSATEVADEFGVTANAVRLVKMRVLRRLRTRLREHPAADP